MLLEPKQTFIAYRCPSCGQAVLGIVGAFALKADMLRLKCPCGDSHMTVMITPDKKIRLSVPCLFCEKDHSFLLSESVFFQKELFLLNCSMTGMDIAFLGSEDKVNDALKANEEELNLILKEAGAASLSDILRKKKEEEEEVLPDAQVYDIVRFVVKELEADGAIHCPCGSGSYDFEVVPNGIRVFCPTCDAEYIFPANSVAAAQEFLQCDDLTLQ